jgi:hypothetical protein
MKHFRVILFPLLLVFLLLFAQQAGAEHAYHHVFEDLTQHQDGKKMPHSDNCQRCADYAQLCNALNVSVHKFTPLVFFDEMVRYSAIPFRTIRILAAVARAPPYSA